MRQMIAAGNYRTGIPQTRGIKRRWSHIADGCRKLCVPWVCWYRMAAMRLANGDSQPPIAVLADTCTGGIRRGVSQCFTTGDNDLENMLFGPRMGLASRRATIRAALSRSHAGGRSWCLIRRCIPTLLFSGKVRLVPVARPTKRRLRSSVSAQGRVKQFSGAAPREPRDEGTNERALGPNGWRGSLDDALLAGTTASTQTVAFKDQICAAVVDAVELRPDPSGSNSPSSSAPHELAGPVEAEWHPERVSQSQRSKQALNYANVVPQEGFDPAGLSRPPAWQSPLLAHLPGVGPSHLFLARFFETRPTE